MKVSAIKPYPNNPRINSGAVASVKASIEQYGYNVPIAVDSKDVVVLGHTRLEALKQLQVKQVRVIVLDHLSEEKIRAFRIIDNKLAEKSEWDEEMLMAELRSLGDGLPEVEVFFQDGELERMLKEVSGARVTQKDVDAAKKGHDDLFADRSKKAEAGMVEIICQHCLEKFFVQRATR